MDTMAERLKHALDLREMAPADLIKQTGLSRSGVYFLLDGTTTADKVRATTVAKVCKALRINREWLVTGRGAMTGEAFGSDPSQAARLSAPTVVNTTQALRTFLARRGIEYDPIDHAALFVAAYREAEKLADNPSSEALMSFASAVADLVQTHVGG